MSCVIFQFIMDFSIYASTVRRKTFRKKKRPAKVTRPHLFGGNMGQIAGSLVTFRLFRDKVMDAQDGSVRTPSRGVYLAPAIHKTKWIGFAYFCFFLSWDRCRCANVLADFVRRGRTLYDPSLIHSSCVKHTQWKWTQLRWFKYKNN